MKKTFACGHRGKGAYCHRCVQEAKLAEELKTEQEERRKKKRGWNHAFGRDPIDLRGRPEIVVKGARRLLNELRQGGNWISMGGKKLQGDRSLVRFPLPMQYRLLCELTEDGLVPVSVLSHEEYNQRWRRQ
jgi:hypothetical protein